MLCALCNFGDAMLRESLKLASIGYAIAICIAPNFEFAESRIRSVQNAVFITVERCQCF